jgi:chitinase
LQVSFAVGGADGALSFTPAAQSVVEFKSDIQAAKVQGRRIFISIGGADAPIAVTPTNNATFAGTLKVRFFF